MNLSNLNNHQNRHPSIEFVWTFIRCFLAYFSTVLASVLIESILGQSANRFDGEAPKAPPLRPLA